MRIIYNKSNLPHTMIIDPLKDIIEQEYQCYRHRNLNPSNRVRKRYLLIIKEPGIAGDCRCCIQPVRLEKLCVNRRRVIAGTDGSTIWIMRPTSPIVNTLEREHSDTA